MAGLPKHYAKMGFKKGWAAYRAAKGGHVAKKRRSPDGDGNPTAPTRSGINVHLPVHNIREFDKERLGAILDGLLMEALKPVAIDLTAYYPPGATAEDNAQWEKLTDERNLGRELFHALGYALAHRRVTPSQWARFYSDAQRAVGAVGGGAGAGFAPPLGFPTTVSGRFGEARPDGSYHRGVDLLAQVGSAVHAPAAARVDKVFHEDDGGLVLRLALQRPDGGYAAETTTGDDSGLLVTFAHLQDAAVKEGDVVGAGQLVARSGNSGRATSGPHLHVMAEYFDDAPVMSMKSNARYFVDPTGLWGGEEALTGQGYGQPLQAGSAMQVIVEPVAGVGGGLIPGLGGGAGTTISIGHLNNTGGFNVAGGNVVNTNLKAVFPLGSGGSGEGGLSNAPIPDALRGVVQQVVGQGGTILQGVGNLAGQLFGQWVSPEGVGQLVKLGGQLLGAAGALATIGGPIATVLAGPAAALGPAGPFISGALAIGGPIASVLGPVAAGLGGMSSAIPGTDVIKGAMGAIQQGLNVVFPSTSTTTRYAGT